jgi:hypothetical protein
MRTATVNGIRAALRARGITVLNANDTRAFTWNSETGNALTDGATVITVTAYTPTPDSMAAPVQIKVYAQRDADAEALARRVSDTLSDYTGYGLWPYNADDYTDTQTTDQTENDAPTRPRYGVLHSAIDGYYIWDSVEFTEVRAEPHDGTVRIWRTDNKSVADEYAARLNSEPNGPDTAPFKLGQTIKVKADALSPYKGQIGRIEVVHPVENRRHDYDVRIPGVDHYVLFNARDLEPISADELRKLQDEATEIGISRGWDHANFVNAYGGELHGHVDVPLTYAVIDWSFYRSGFETGIDRYENGQWQDGTSRDDEGDDTGTEPSAQHCATIGHGDRIGTHRLLMLMEDGTWSLDRVCATCDRYYQTYAGKVGPHALAIPVPTDRTTLTVGYVPDMAISVWPVETTDGDTRYGHMLTLGRDTLYAGVDISIPATQHSAHAAFAVAARIIAQADHADSSDYGTRDGDCPEHGKPYTECGTYRRVYMYADSLGMWREDWAGEHGNVWDSLGYVGHFEAIMHDNHDVLIGFGKVNGITPHEMISQYFELVGAEPSDAQRHGYITWAKIIGAEHGAHVVNFLHVGDANDAQQIIDAGTDTIIPAVQDAFDYADQANTYGPDDLLGELDLEADADHTLWNAYNDAYRDQAMRDMIERARDYLA